MARLTKTIKIQIEDAEKYQDLLETTNQQYQQVVAFYLAIIQLNIRLLGFDTLRGFDGFDTIWFRWFRYAPLRYATQPGAATLLNPSHFVPNLLNPAPRSLPCKGTQPKPQPKDLTNKELLTSLERLSHRTKENPNPPYDLSEIAHKLPSGVRRSAINKAIGLAKAWRTSYGKWQMRKSKHLKRQDKRAKKGKTTFPFIEHPPQFPTTSESNIVWYTTEYKLIDSRHIKLKVFNGKGTWEYVDVKLSKTMRMPSGYKRLSPELIHKDDKWYLHQPIQRQIKLIKISEQLKANPNLRICAVDLGLNNTAVLTVQDASGKVYATEFIRGHEIHSRRLRLLRRIFSKQSVTKIIQEGVKFAKNLWRKISRINRDYAHKVSYWIVKFALKHGCDVIVFEHLKNLRPEKGSKSRRMNQRLMFWLKGTIFKNVQYKATHQGILVSRVNPRNTSKICPNCSHVENYGKIETTKRYQNSKLFKCRICGYQANADFVGSRNVGRRFFARYVKSNIIKEHQDQANLREALQLEFA